MGGGCSTRAFHIDEPSRPAEAIPPERRVLLEVKILASKNLPKMDIVGTADAYLRVKLPSGAVQTKVAKDSGTSAVWNETFKAVIDESTPEIRFELWDRDVGSIRDDFVGFFLLKLIEMPCVRREFAVVLAPGVKPAATGTTFVSLSAGFVRDYVNLKLRLQATPGVVADDGRERLLVPLRPLPGMLEVQYQADSEGDEGFKKLRLRMLETCAPLQQALAAAVASSSVQQRKRTQLFVMQQRLGVKLTVVRKLPKPDKPPKTAGRFEHNVVAVTAIDRLHHYTPLSRILAMIGEEEPILDVPLQGLIAEQGGAMRMPFADTLTVLKPGCVAIGDPPGNLSKGHVFLPIARNALVRVPWNETAPGDTFAVLNTEETTDRGTVLYAAGQGARKFSFVWHGKAHKIANVAAGVTVVSTSDPVPSTQMGIVLLDPNSQRSAIVKLLDIVPLQ